MTEQVDIYNTMTDKDKTQMWYIIALQALHELDRPLLLSESFASKVINGEKAVFSTRSDDGGYLYEVI